MIIETVAGRIDTDYPLPSTKTDGSELRFFSVSTDDLEYPWVLWEDLASLCELPEQNMTEDVRTRCPEGVRMLRGVSPIISAPAALTIIKKAIDLGHVEDETEAEYRGALTDALAHQSIITRPEDPNSATKEAHVRTFGGHGNVH